MATLKEALEHRDKLCREIEAATKDNLGNGPRGGKVYQAGTEKVYWSDYMKYLTDDLIKANDAVLAFHAVLMR